MARALAHRVRKDMALLGACELMLSAILVYFLLLSTDTALPLLATLLAPSWSQIYLAVAIALAIVGMAATMGLYRPQICQDPRRLLIAATIAGTIASPIVLWMRGTPLTAVGLDRIVWLAEVVVGWLLVVLASRTIFGAILRHGRLPRRILTIAGDEQAGRLRDPMYRHHGPLFDPVAIDPRRIEHAMDALREGRLWGVVVADGVPHAATGEVSRLCDALGTRIFGEARFQEEHLGRIDPAGAVAAHMPNGLAMGDATPRASEIAKRLFDLAVSLLLLVATLPPMVVVAVLIAVDSPGSVLYRQERIGLRGRPFMLLKFRSMRADAEACGTPRWAQKHDPRITRIGHFIRQTRIDELPQLLNVLRGDMSMIGPRPERLRFVGERTLAIPCYAKRAAVGPGITGWAQVNYPYGASVEDAREKLGYDLYYVKNRSFLLDVVILCSTVRVILFREGAR
jgi:exopolysaccharide biosynthesis polyprenyl glycosylphosphotransferase